VTIEDAGRAFSYRPATSRPDLPSLRRSGPSGKEISIGTARDLSCASVRMAHREGGFGTSKGGVG